MSRSGSHRRRVRSPRAVLGERPDDGSSPASGDRPRIGQLARSRIGRLIAAACLIAVGAGVALLVAHGSRTRVAPAKAVPLGTVTVRRGDLVVVHHYHGKTSYPSRGSVHLGGSGTVTSLPHIGQILSQGTSVAGVDDSSIGVLLGGGALYRTLGSPDTGQAQLAVQVAEANLLSAQAPAPSPAAGGGGSKGSASSDVSSATRTADAAQAQVTLAQAHAQLRAAQAKLHAAQTPQQGSDVALVAGNMTALGYYGGATDIWNATLQAGVTQWQEHIGATPSGEIVPADVLVLRGAERVSGVKGGVGAAPSGVTISLSSPSRGATFRLSGKAPGALARGRRVRISARGRTTTGRVTSVKTTHGSASTGSRTSTTIQVAFDQSSALARIGSPHLRVSMAVRTSDRRDVLTVPTQALLALASGGYALQLPDGRLLAIHTGVVQGPVIEVSGRGVHAGLRVVSVT